MPLIDFNNNAVRPRLRLIQLCSCLCLTAGLNGCQDKSPEESIDSVSWALSRNLSLTDDTFLNSIHPDNNNGASDSIYTGVNGQGGVMRGLVRFAMPSGLQGHVTVTNVKLSLTTRALGGGAAGPAFIQSLQAVSEAWVQGNGVGDVSMLNTVGQICSDLVSGVTWNQADCTGAPGSGTTWSTPGGTVSAAISGQVTTPGVTDTVVIWDSAVGGNALMNTDVQNWIDTPSSNNGWRISSSDEVTLSFAQRFYSSESGVANAPSLAVTYDCKAGFEIGSDGVTCVSTSSVGTGGTSGAGGASSSSVAGGSGSGGVPGSGGSSNAGGGSSVGGVTTAGTSTGVAGTSAAAAGQAGATTGGASATGGAPTNEIVSGGCACRVGGHSGPARLPTFAGIAALLGALSIRRVSRRRRAAAGSARCVVSTESRLRPNW